MFLLTNQFVSLSKFGLVVAILVGVAACQSIQETQSKIETANQEMLAEIPLLVNECLTALHTDGAYDYSVVEQRGYKKSSIGNKRKKTIGYLSDLEFWITHKDCSFRLDNYGKADAIVQEFGRALNIEGYRIAGQDPNAFRSAQIFKNGDKTITSSAKSTNKTVSVTIIKR